MKRLFQSNYLIYFIFNLLKFIILYVLSMYVKVSKEPKCKSMKIFWLFCTICICMYLCIYRQTTTYISCINSFKKVWTQILQSFKSCSRHVKDYRLEESLLVMVFSGNKNCWPSSVNHLRKRNSSSSSLFATQSQLGQSLYG